MTHPLTALTAEPIAQVIDQWVNDEALSANITLNAYLDSFNASRSQMGMNPDDTANFMQAKHNSHNDRQLVWGKAMIDEPTNDFLTARHIFNSLMQIIGIYRRICVLTLNNQQEYDQKRLGSNGIGIDTVKAVNKSLQIVRSVNGNIASPSAQEAHELALGTFASKGNDIDFVRSRVPLDFGKAESPSVARLKESQGHGVHAVTFSIVAAMRYRSDEIEQVPFLEPKSISLDPAVYYPFASK